MSSLKSIREKIAQQNNKGIVSKELTQEELYVAWGLFIEKLKSKNNHSAVTNFKNATLKVINDNVVEITTQGEIHKAFIEVERPELILHLQNYFNNRLLMYQVVVNEKEEEESEPGEKALNRKQQYLKIIEEYPLVKELRDKLRLELE